MRDSLKVGIPQNCVVVEWRVGRVPPGSKWALVDCDGKVMATVEADATGVAKIHDPPAGSVDFVQVGTPNVFVVYE